MVEERGGGILREWMELECGGGRKVGRERDNDLFWGLAAPDSKHSSSIHSH
jgi:hypothetical protein